MKNGNFITALSTVGCERHFTAGIQNCLQQFAYVLHGQAKALIVSKACGKIFEEQFEKNEKIIDPRMFLSCIDNLNLHITCENYVAYTYLHA